MAPPPASDSAFFASSSLRGCIQCGPEGPYYDRYGDGTSNTQTLALRFAGYLIPASSA